MGIAVLGPLAVDGATGRLRHHDRVVLTVLAIRPGDVVAAERLADALWGNTPPGTWTKVVQGCVVRLRKVLGNGAIETTPQGYRLALKPDEIDSLRFERLVGRGRELLALAEPDRAEHVLSEAVGLWRGEAFADVDGWGDGRAEAARLEELRRDAEELGVDAALRAGRCHEVLDRARRLVDAAPLRERRWALLALAQYQAGQQAEALATLRKVRTVLGTELGVDPGPDMVALEQAILRQDPTLAVTTAASEPSTACPYRGLLPFGVADGDTFFGREDDVAECLRRLAAHGVLAVAGPSGSGKSSLVRAGVAAALSRNGHQVRVVTPGAHPMDVLDGLAAHRSPPALVVDQCEEVATLCESASERTEFFDGLLAHAAEAPLVLAVRADQLGTLSADAAAATLLERGMFLLRPMGTDQLRACIERPAEESGLLVEPGLTDLLLTELEDEPGALPLLSHALRETWIQREGRTLTVAGYRRSGGIREAVARTAEEVYDAVPESDRPLVRSLFLRLVTEAPDGQPVRSRVPRRVLVHDEQHAAIVERLVNARLVVSDGEDLELAHEALIRAWPRLHQWLDDDAEGRSILHHLTAAADTWDSMGRPGSELYRGIRLAQALDWRQQVDPDLTGVEHEFLAASQALVDADLAEARRRVQQERAARRRTRRLAVGLAAVLALALVAAAGATWFQQAASDRAAEAAEASTKADANRLAALSKSVRGIDLSMLLAAQAFRTADTPATRDGLLSAMLDHARATAVHQLGRRTIDGVLADRGRTLFVSTNSQVLAREVGSPDPARVILRWGNKASYIAGAPTDDLVGLWRYQGDTPVVGVFDSQGHEQLLLEGHREIGGAPLGFGFSPDSRRLYLDVLVERGDRPHGLYLHEYDLAGGERLRTTLVHRQPAPGEFIISMMSPDGAWSISWLDSDYRSAVLAENRTGRRSPLTVPQRPAEPSWFHAFSAGAALIWSDGAVSLFDVTGKQTQVLETHRAEVDSVVVAPDGTWAATGDGSGVVTVWDVDAGSRTWRPRETLPSPAGRTRLAVSPDSSTLVSVSGDGTVVVWDLTQGAGPATTFPGLGAHGWISNPPVDVVPGRLVVAPTRDAPWTADSGPVATQVSATFLDPRTGRVVDQIPVGRNLGGAFGSSVSVSPDRSLVAATYGFGTVVLDSRTREVITRIRLDEIDFYGDVRPEPVWCTAWTPDGSKLLLCADGDWLDAEDGDLVVVDTGSWQVQDDRVPVGGAVQTAELSPDGGLLALGMALEGVDEAPPGKVKLLDTQTLEVVEEIDLGTDQYAFDVSFSRDGGLLAIGTESGQVSIADVESGELVRGPVAAHSAFVTQVAWLPDDRTVVSTGGDGRLTLFDAGRGLVRASMPVATGVVDDSHTYLLGTGEEQVSALTRSQPGRTYSLDPQTWLERACAVAGRDLTRDEWSSYLPGHRYERTCAGRG